MNVAALSGRSFEYIADDFHGRLGPLGVTTHRESHPIKEAIFKACEEEFGLQYSDQNDGNHWGYFDMMVHQILKSSI